MSPSPPQEAVAEGKAQDELEENGQVVVGEAEDGAGETSGAPVKRGRGRPKGSKNKKGSTFAADVSATDAPKKKRGRPPKEKKPEEVGTDGEPAPKRKRGRPPKNPKPEGEADATSGAEGGEPSEKKKRGRPPKSATST
ncbi:hypothetical protein PILCRDRAFT_822010 [Piloderma croceum F 1598]|uniref:Uncharacterized protein n=1 Tax=Piloderma croceum (strain F 1598) TaxID=765440 RepID=A0A0C3F7X1_PILCF|nr:hypothetical protein PILCRDRAFT_822010 [Piloderma croceum F 1598]